MLKNDHADAFDNTESPTTTIVVPQNLSSKEAKKFRKDARRKARAKGQPEDKLVFVVEGRKTGSADKRAAEEKSRESNDNSNSNSNSNNVNQRQQKPKRPFPRINDLLAEHTARQKLDAELAARAAADDALPAAEKARYVAIDCEMVGVGSDGRKSALARASAVDWTGRVLLDVFVRVPERVTDFRTRVSGVRPGDIKATNAGAVDHEECRRAVGALLEGKVLVGHALKNDLGVLLLDHPRGDVRDTARYKPFMRATGRSGGKLRPRKLRDLVYEQLGRRIQVEGEAHSSVDDATASMELFKSVRIPWEKELATKTANGRGKK